MTLPDVETLLRDIRQGERQRDRLLAIAKERRGWVASNLPASQGTVRALLEAASDQEPRESRATAGAALHMALDLREELVLEALVEVGNALRRCGDLRQAEKAMQIAGDLRTITGIDPLATARYFSILASLRNVQRDYEEAILAVRRSRRLYERYGAPRLRAKELVKEAFIHTDHDALDPAMKVGDQALRAAREQDERQLMLIAHHNLCYTLVELGLLTPATDMLKSWSKLYSKTATSGQHLRSRWLVARIEFGKGRPHKALAIFTEVCEGLAEEGVGWEYLLACLHLALAHLEVGHHSQVTRICADLSPLCQAMGAPQPALATVSLDETARAREALFSAIQRVRILRPSTSGAINRRDPFRLRLHLPEGEDPRG